VYAFVQKVLVLFQKRGGYSFSVMVNSLVSRHPTYKLAPFACVCVCWVGVSTGASSVAPQRRMAPVAAADMAVGSVVRVVVGVALAVEEGG